MYYLDLFLKYYNYILKTNIDVFKFIKRLRRYYSDDTNMMNMALNSLFSNLLILWKTESTFCVDCQRNEWLQRIINNNFHLYKYHCCRITFAESGNILVFSKIIIIQISTINKTVIIFSILYCVDFEWKPYCSRVHGISSPSGQ